MISAAFQNANARWLEFIKATKKWTWPLLFGKRNHWLAFLQRQPSVNSQWVLRQPVSRPVRAWGKGHWPPKKVVASNHDGDIKTEKYFPPKDFFFLFYLQDRVLKCTHTVSCLCAQLRGRAVLGSVCSPSVSFVGKHVPLMFCGSVKRRREVSLCFSEIPEQWLLPHSPLAARKRRMA